MDNHSRAKETSSNNHSGINSQIQSLVNSPLQSPFGSTTNLHAIRSHTQSPIQITSSNEDGGLISNILPSYHMYQSTVSKNLVPTQENFKVDPPMYEMSPVTSGQQSMIGTPESFPQSTENSEFPFPTPLEEPISAADAAIWENTILANAHRLPNLTDKTGLSIKVHVTEKVCQKGVQPTELDPSNLEFKQGDFIHGYVTILNSLPVPVTFDMVYVVFEGIILAHDTTRGMVDPEKPSRVFKFLNMLDLFALWSFANIDRLVTDNGDPHDWCDGEIDPYDNTVLSIDVKRLFQPNITYKRYFSFRVPDKLLDDSCEKHSLNRHIDVPPSLGIPRKSMTPSQMLANKEHQIRDLSFINASISYSIDARVIGKALDYGYKGTGPKDQYVTATESIQPIRVIPLPDPDYEYNLAAINETNMFYKAFSDSIKTKILVMEGLETGLVPIASTGEKLRQLYSNHTIAKISRKLEDHSYQCIVPIKKKTLTGHTKILGILLLTTPREQYRTFYAPPMRFRTEELPSGLSELNIPLEFAFFVEGTGKASLPEIKTLSTELVVLTIQSRKHPIPLEFNHDMCFREIETLESDNFDTIVIKRFQQYLTEVNLLIAQHGNDVVKFETQMYQDLKCLATLQTKYINLMINEADTKYYTTSETGSGVHTSVKTIPWELEPATSGSLYTKKFSLNVDVNECHLKGTENKNKKGFDYLTLVPSFQNCMMARLYYIKISAKVGHEVLVVNVPLRVERS